MTQMPPQTPVQPPYAAPGGGLKPHRGTTVLVLGIVSLVCSCVICGIIAWVMGKNDLRAMDAGQMDPSGRGTTNVGKILGMISVILTIVGVIVWVIMLIAGVSVFTFSSQR